MSDDITTRIAQLTIIAPPSGWVERAVSRFDQETAMNTATDYANPTRLVAYKVHTFDALLRDAEVYDALEAPGPRADARAARLGAARIVGTAILFDGADAVTCEQAEEVISRALIVARDREPDDGAWIAAMFAQMRDNRGTAEIAATMIEAIAVRESYGLPCVEWRAALDVMRAILDPGATPWVSEPTERPRARKE